MVHYPLLFASKKHLNKLKIYDFKSVMVNTLIHILFVYILNWKCNDVTRVSTRYIKVLNISQIVSYLNVTILISKYYKSV